MASCCFYFDAARKSPVNAVFVILLSLCVFRDAQAALLKTIAPQDLDAAVRINEHLLVVFVSKDCSSCKDAELELSTLTARDNVELQVTVVRIVDSDLPKQKYGLTAKTVPAVVFYRHRNPLIYDGKIEAAAIDEWITYNHESALKILNDNDFEHLTQAGAGATTGDWLVIFCDVTDESCLHFQHVYEGVATKLKARQNVAFVDTSKNVGLVQRFTISKPLTIILFRLGKMYEYSIDKIDADSLTGFAAKFYKNVKSVNVPAQQTPFDLLTIKIAQSLQTNASLFLVLALAVIVFATVGYLTLSTHKGKAPTGKKE